MICKICGQEVKDRSMTFHLITNNKSVCPTCGKSTNFLGMTKGYMKHYRN